MLSSVAWNMCIKNTVHINKKGTPEKHILCFLCVQLWHSKVHTETKTSTTPHVITEEAGTCGDNRNKRNWLQTRFQGTSDNLRSLFTTSNTTSSTTTTTSTLTSRTDTTPSEQNKSWGREPLASRQIHTHTVYTDIQTHMLENIGRLENERGRYYVTCEREEVVSKRWSVEDVTKQLIKSRGNRRRAYGKNQHRSIKQGSYERRMYKL